MRRKLAKLRNEAAQILATYEAHKDSEDARYTWTLTGS